VRLFRESYERESTTPSRHRDNVGQIVRLLLKGAETGGGPLVRSARGHGVRRTPTVQRLTVNGPGEHLVSADSSHAVPFHPGRSDPRSRLGGP
jgi:hypothetical protein